MKGFREVGSLLFMQIGGVSMEIYLKGDSSSSFFSPCVELASYMAVVFSSALQVQKDFYNVPIL